MGYHREKTLSNNCLKLLLQLTGYSQFYLTNVVTVYKALKGLVSLHTSFMALLGPTLLSTLLPLLLPYTHTKPRHEAVNLLCFYGWFPLHLKFDMWQGSPAMQHDASCMAGLG